MISTWISVFARMMNLKIFTCKKKLKFKFKNNKIGKIGNLEKAKYSPIKERKDWMEVFGSRAIWVVKSIGVFDARKKKSGKVDKYPGFK